VVKYPGHDTLVTTARWVGVSAGTIALLAACTKGSSHATPKPTASRQELSSPKAVLGLNQVARGVAQQALERYVTAPVCPTPIAPDSGVCRDTSLSSATSIVLRSNQKDKHNSTLSFTLTAVKGRTLLTLYEVGDGVEAADRFQAILDFSSTATPQGVNAATKIDSLLQSPATRVANASNQEPITGTDSQFSLHANRIDYTGQGAAQATDSLAGALQVIKGFESHIPH